MSDLGHTALQVPVVACDKIVFLSEDHQTSLPCRCHGLFTRSPAASPSWPSGRWCDKVTGRVFFDICLHPYVPSPEVWSLDHRVILARNLCVFVFELFCLSTDTAYSFDFPMSSLFSVLKLKTIFFENFTTPSTASFNSSWHCLAALICLNSSANRW